MGEGRVTIVGAGLAGSEAALLLSDAGIPVELFEMRPGRLTPAHRTGWFAELVCSNSLGSEETGSGKGLLKEELRILGSPLVRLAGSARVNINDSFIKSPSSASITKKFIEVGETVGMMSSLFQVGDLSSVELVIYIAETELGNVKLDQQAEITVDTYPEKSFKGKVIYISPEAEFTPKNIQTQEERTKLVFAVKIKIENPDFELKDGMPADAMIKL